MDCIKQKHLKAQHCPADEMADFFTKPLQEGSFQKFQNMILGINKDKFDAHEAKYSAAMEQHPLEIACTRDTSGQECVGQMVNGKTVWLKEVLQRVKKSHSNNKTIKMTAGIYEGTFIRFNSIAN